MVDTEIWKPIDGFEDYMISDEGRVYNNRAGIVMALSRTMQGDLKVTLVSKGERVTRSIRVLVAEAFIDNPHPVMDDNFMAFDTVIVLDGNKDHIWHTNLAWRPYWFAYEYHQQFHKNHPDEYWTRQVYNVNLNRVYNSMFECATHEGLLLDDLHKAILTESPAFPSNNLYIWYKV